MRYAFVLNPAAQHGRAGRMRTELEAALEQTGVASLILETSVPGHATELAHGAAQNHEVVVAVGGDGTVQEVARGLIETSAVMGIIPAGTGNDFAKAIGMPTELPSAIDALLNADRVAVDVGKMTWRDAESDQQLEGVFTNCVGMGFDAMAAMATSKYKFLGGNLAYVAAVVETLGKWRQSGASVEVHASGEDSFELDRLIHNDRFFLVEIDNGFSVGGGFLLTPDAEINDGLLDVCFVEHVPVRRVLRIMPKTFTGNHINEPEVRIFRTRHITIRSSEGLPVQADGEIVSTSAVYLDATILPVALTVIAPKLRKPAKSV
ncbi:MAG: diacylglycerol kinase family lipid kinase [Rubricoccaceae bacterium]|nr:diacylglycerol kinase family lipid kinase [Rubricoccaceae bacterium]